MRLTAYDMLGIISPINKAIRRLERCLEVRDLYTEQTSELDDARLALCNIEVDLVALRGKLRAMEAERAMEDG